MLNWFNKYRSPFAAKSAADAKPASPAKSGPASAAEKAATAAEKAERKAQQRAQQAEADASQWAPRLQAAQGDDAALLKVALQCPVLDLRQAAVEALVSEQALRQVEAAFRNKDRRVHQIAKKRFEAAVRQRETVARAEALLAGAQALATQPLVPVNHLVALDRDWGALDTGLLEASLVASFTEVRQALGGMAQGQSERQQRHQRRQHQGRELAVTLQLACQAALAPLDAAAPGAVWSLDLAPLIAAAEAAQACLVSDEDPALDAALAQSLALAVQDAQALAARLQWLHAETARPAGEAPVAPVAANAVALVTEADADPVASDPIAAETATGAAQETAEATTAETTEEAPTEAAAASAAEPASEPVVGPGIESVSEAVVEQAAEPASEPVIEPAQVDPAEAASEAVSDAVAESPVHVDAVEAPAAPVAEPVPPPVPALSPAQAWQALPAVRQADWSATLSQRFADLMRQRRPVEVKPAARPPKRATEAARGLSAEQREALRLLLDQADLALAEGHLGPLQQHLQAFDNALARGPALSPSDALAQRAGALQAEHQRLRGWQQWGGGRARDDLAAEAEVLARATAAAADPALANAPKLDLSAHAESIAALRGRWRDLDKLGAAASQALWHRFDTALKAAYQPLAERQAALKAQRQQNLRDRQALLDALEAWPGTPPAAAEAADAQSPAEAPSPAEAQAPADAAPGDTGWKERLRMLDRFHTAWRQLGPLEHTVPAGARDALRQRHQQALNRVEAPVQQARREAAGRRELLIQQAEALVAQAALAAQNPQRPAPAAEGPRRYGAPDAARRGPGDDLPQQVRNLQAEWQNQARELPLARGVEAALWNRFRAALDAVFAQRQAVWNARDAETAALQAERDGLIARLLDLPADAPVAEARRVLAEVDQAWRQQASDLPRGAAAALEARFRDARQAVQQRLADVAVRHWQQWCDALTGGVQQAVLREQSGDASPSGDAEPASALALPADLPPAWARALSDRAAAPRVAGPLPAAAFDALLLPLEAALDMPATAEQQAARRLLKLQALKQTLEGRSPASAAPSSPADALQAALRQALLPPAQHQRVLAVLAALRRAGPGALGLPQPRI